MKFYLFCLFCCLGWVKASFAALPPVWLSDVQGKQLRVDQLLHKGEPVVVAFFATWCKPCLRELQAFHDNYELWQSQRPFRLVAVALDEAHQQYQLPSLVEREGWQFQVLIDDKGELKRALQVQSLPRLFLFDSHGTLCYTHNGYNEGDEDELWQKLRSVP